MKPRITILQLYSRDMNIYGDWGNVLTLIKRLQWAGYNPMLIEYNPGDTFPDHVDIIIGGGGQDAGQAVIQNDLQIIAPKLHELAEADVPMLVICGLYQLFGNFFKTSDDKTIKGIGIFNLETHASTDRMIGNIVTHSDEFGDIIGYENHSGKTYLGDGVSSLAKVQKGAGNNGQDGTEGARYRHVLGSYLHGSLLPKNPAIADWLIKQAITKSGGSYETASIDDAYANAARRVAMQRPR